MTTIYKCSACVLLVALLGLGCAMLPPAEKKSGTALFLEYTFFPEGRPFTGVFTLDRDGSYEYVKKDGKGGSTPEFRGRFPEKDMGVIVDTLVHTHRFFSINPDVKPGEVKMDMSTEFVRVSHDGKTGTIGGYAAARIPEFAPVIRYVQEIFAAARKDSGRDVSAAPDYFSLEYVTRGSELPVESRFNLYSDGSYTYSRRHLNRIDEQGFSGTMSRVEMAALVDRFVNEYKFFSLPEKARTEIMIMDAATCTMTITYKEKTHVISGYAAESVPEYAAVMHYMNEIMGRLANKHEGKK